MEGPDVMTGRLAGITEQLTDRCARPAGAGGLIHTALLYGNDDEYRAGLAEFARAAAVDGAPMQVVLPWRRMQVARGALAMLPLRVDLDDMADVGCNPARLIPVGCSFADDHPGEHVYCLWEPAWAGRSAAERSEIARHEGLCNLAFSDRAMTVLCAYDTARLGPDLIADVELTHPVVIWGGRSRSSATYLGPGGLPASCERPLPLPESGVESLSFTDHLGSVREFAARHAGAAGLSLARGRDLMLAASEIAANAVSYAAGGVIRAWRADAELICQIEDSGFISDPLAGRRQRPPDWPGGHGLWLVNLVCDLVERRTAPSGTITRLHMRTW
ncbi:MAG TPA: sensor histidine kinase [Streptosporangiaceae bacterium]|nr:sensor histidine kinase [Streptosporangiaceae bacterium]